MFNFGANFEQPTDLANLNQRLSQLSYPLDATSEAILQDAIKNAIPSLNRVQSITLKSGDISFDVRNTDVMRIAASAAVSITTISNGYDGQILTLLFDDANTTLVHNAT